MCHDAIVVVTITGLGITVTAVGFTLVTLQVSSGFIGEFPQAIKDNVVECAPQLQRQQLRVGILKG
jgi:hypothetical protein